MKNTSQNCSECRLDVMTSHGDGCLQRRKKTSHTDTSNLRLTIYFYLLAYISLPEILEWWSGNNSVIGILPRRCCHFANSSGLGLYHCVITTASKSWFDLCSYCASEVKLGSVHTQRVCDCLMFVVAYYEKNHCNDASETQSQSPFWAESIVLFWILWFCLSIEHVKISCIYVTWLW